MAGYIVLPLPSITRSTTNVNSSAVGNLDDAQAIGVYLPTSASTGTSYTLAVEPTDTGVAFRTLVYPGSTSLVTLSSAAPSATISPVAFKQIRVVATAAEVFTAWELTKQLYV